MLPAVIDPALAPPGEVEIFRRLRDETPNDWTALHSVDLPRHVRQVEGEVDFVIIVPGSGVVCLEVKSHLRVARGADGLWQLGRDEPTARSPFEQASEGMHSLRRRLADDSGLHGVPFVSAVAFPQCRFDVESIEWEPWQVADQVTLLSQGLESFLLACCAGNAQRLVSSDTAGWFDPSLRLPSRTQSDRLVNRVRPIFEVGQSPKARRKAASEERYRYTENQFAALDWLEENNRVVFNGGAGTGKTFLALESARRSALRGEAVLLVCFNRLLGQWLESEATALGEGVRVGNFHSLLLEITDAEVPHSPSSDFFSTQLPELALEALLDGHPFSGFFDTLIIDEAQDLCTETNLDVMDLMLKSGLGLGRLRVFGDFLYQRIFQDEDGREMLQARTALTQFPLLDNCRNRPRIGQLSSLALGANPYTRYLRADDGFMVDLRLYDDQAQQTQLVVNAIDHLRSEGFQLGDIALLSPRANGAWSAVADPHRGWLAPAASRASHKVRTSTIHAFKGLESPAVIVCDIDSLEDRDRLLLYTASSRATERLVLLTSSAVRSRLAVLATGDIDA